APAEGLRLAIAEPAMEAERRKFETAQFCDEAIVVCSRDELFAVGETGDQRFGEQVGLAHDPTNSLSSAAGSAGASCSNVHCFGSLSGRQRRKPVPWGKRWLATLSSRASATSGGLTRRPCTAS